MHGKVTRRGTNLGNLFATERFIKFDHVNYHMLEALLAVAFFVLPGYYSNRSNFFELGNTALINGT